MIGGLEMVFVCDVETRREGGWFCCLGEMMRWLRFVGIFGEWGWGIMLE